MFEPRAPGNLLAHDLECRRVVFEFFQIRIAFPLGDGSALRFVDDKIREARIFAQIFPGNFCGNGHFPCGLNAASLRFRKNALPGSKSDFFRKSATASCLFPCADSGKIIFCGGNRCSRYIVRSRIRLQVSERDARSRKGCGTGGMKRGAGFVFSGLAEASLR